MHDHQNYSQRNYVISSHTLKMNFKVQTVTDILNRNEFRIHEIFSV